MAIGDTHDCVFWLSQTSANTTFFPKLQTTFLTCFCRGLRQKYVGKRVLLNQVSNSQPSGHESEMLTSEPPGQAVSEKKPDHLIHVKLDFNRLVF